jgi:ABC-type uncharacterized transport system involved in gliding motility auxiliary subunit
LKDYRTDLKRTFGVKKGIEKYFKLLVYFIVIVLINMAGLTLFFRIDLTKNKIYSLSKASQKVVSTLSEPLTISVFFTKNLPAPHNNTERYLRDLLEEYAIHANNFFNYRFYNVSPEAEAIDRTTKANQELASNYGIYPVQIQIIEKDEVKFKKAYMGLVLIHGDMIERIPTLMATDGLEYKLTTAIQKLNNKISAFLSLTQKIQIKLFLSSSLKTVAPYMGLDTLAELPETLEQIVNKLNRKTYEKLEFIHLDPTENQSLEKESKKYHIMNLKWPSISEEKIPAGNGVIGLVLEYARKAVEIPILNVMRIPLIGTRYDLMDSERLEEAISQSLESLIDINEDLGYLADHGTPTLRGGIPMGARDAESLSVFSDVAGQNYTIKPMNLKEEPIPEGLSSLVIAGPVEEFSDYELFLIDQALMRGTNIALFLDAFKEVRPNTQQSFGFNQGPTYVPLKTGLEKLLAHYGIRIKTSYIMDENCFRQRVPRQFGGGERAIYFAPLIQNKFINHNLDFMRNIKGLVALKASPIELVDTRISEIGIKASKVFASSEKSWEMRERINLNPMFIQPPGSDEEKRSIPIAYMLEGQFPSFFKGKPLPEKTTHKTDADKGEKKDGSEKESDQTTDTKKAADLSNIEREGGILLKSKPSKLFILASSEMLKDTVLDPEGRNPNTMFIMNVLDALSNRTDFAMMRSKEQSYNPLYDTTTVAKTFVKTFNIAGLPVLVVLFGFSVWLRRRSRKRHIQMMFQK